MLTGTIPARDHARKLRRELSLPEVKLWQALRLRPAGFKFRRQHAAGNYVIDFFCTGAKLAVEVDGAFHGYRERGAFDARRDAWLGSQGLRVFRIPAAEVLNDTPRVVEAIAAICIERARMPLHHALKKGAVPLPEVGEDFKIEAHAWTT